VEKKRKVSNITHTLEVLDDEKIFEIFEKIFFVTVILLFVKVGFGHLMHTNLHK
jgi:hypothetical protein